MRLEKSYDEKSKATVYTLKKTEGGKSAIIKVLDYGNNGLDNTDGIFAKGNTSVFTNEEIKTNLFANYKNTKETTKLEAVEYSAEDGKIDLKNGKTYSLGSFAELTGAAPAATAASSASTQSTLTPQSIAALNTNTPLLDTSLYENYGALQGATQTPNFDYEKYQDATNSYNGIGALVGMLSLLGGDCDNFTSTFLPMMMGQMAPDYGPFYSSPAPTVKKEAKKDTPAASNKEATTDNTTKDGKTTKTETPAGTTDKAAAPAVTSVSSTTPKHKKTGATSHKAANVETDIDKEYAELQKTGKTEKAKKETATHKDGTVSTKNADGNKVIQKFKHGILVEETEFYSDGSFNKTQHSEIKGATYQKNETVGVNKDGLQIRNYTNYENGTRIVESRRNGKLVQTDTYNQDGECETVVTGKKAVKHDAPGNTGVLKYVDDAHLFGYAKGAYNFFFGK